MKPSPPQEHTEQKDPKLRDLLYAGLQNLNTGFDSPAIRHCSPVDFLTVIDRCERHKVRIFGIEVFAINASKESEIELLAIEICEGADYGWARRLASKYINRSEITICASYLPVE